MFTNLFKNLFKKRVPSDADERVMNEVDKIKESFKKKNVVKSLHRTAEVARILDDLYWEKIHQKQAVIKLLKIAGSDGIHSFEFIAFYMPRIASRIWELKQRGVKITAKREKRGRAWGVRYTLIS